MLPPHPRSAHTPALLSLGLSPAAAATAAPLAMDSTHAHTDSSGSGSEHTHAHQMDASSAHSDSRPPLPALDLPTSPPPAAAAAAAAAAPAAAYPMMDREAGLQRVIETSPDAGSIVSPQPQQQQQQRARSSSMSRRSALSPAAASGDADAMTPVFGSSPGALSSARAAAVAAANAALAAEDAAAAAGSAIPASAGAPSTPASAASPRTFRMRSPKYAAQTMRSPSMFAQATKMQQEGSVQPQSQQQLPLSSTVDRRPSQLRLLSPPSASTSGFPMSVRFDTSGDSATPPIVPLSTTTASHARRPSNAHRRGTSFASFAMFTPSSAAAAAAATAAQQGQQQQRPSVLSRRGSVGLLSSSHQAAAAAAAAAVSASGLTTPAGPLTARGSGSSGGGSGAGAGFPPMLMRRQSTVGSNLTSPAAGSIANTQQQQAQTQGSTPQQPQQQPTPSMQHQLQLHQQALLNALHNPGSAFSQFNMAAAATDASLNSTSLPFEVDLAVRDVLESGEVVDLGGGGGGAGGMDWTAGGGVGKALVSPMVLAARSHARAVEHCFEFLLMMLLLSSLDSGLLLGSLVNLRASFFSGSGSFALLGFLCASPLLGLSLGGMLAPSFMRRLGDEGAARFVAACVAAQGLACACVGLIPDAGGLVAVELVAGVMAAPLALFVPAWIVAQAPGACMPPVAAVVVVRGAPPVCFNPFVALSRMSAHWTSLAQLSAPAGLALGFLLSVVAAIQDEAGSSGRGRSSMDPIPAVQSWGWCFVAQGAALFLCGLAMLAIVARSKSKLLSLRQQPLPLMMSPRELDSEALSRAAALREYETALRREALVKAINASAAVGGGAASPSASVSVRNKALSLRVSASPSKGGQGGGGNGGGLFPSRTPGSSSSSTRHAADSTRSVSSVAGAAAGNGSGRFALEALTVSGMTPHPSSYEEGFGFEFSSGGVGGGGGASSTTSANGNAGAGQRFVSDGSVALAPHMSTSFLGSPQWLGGGGAGGMGGGLQADPSPSSMALSQGSLEILRQSPAHYAFPACGQPMGFAPNGTPLAGAGGGMFTQEGVSFEPFNEQGYGFSAMDPSYQQQQSSSEDLGAFNSLDFANLVSLRFRLLTPSIALGPVSSEDEEDAEDLPWRARLRSRFRAHLALLALMAQNALYVSSTLALVCVQFMLTGLVVWIAPMWLAEFGVAGGGSTGVHWASVSLAWLVVVLPSAAVGVAAGHRSMRGLERRIDGRFDHDEAMRLQLEAIDQAPTGRHGRTGSEASEDGSTPAGPAAAQLSVAPPRISADTEGRKIRLLSNHVCLVLLLLSALLGVACIPLAQASALTPGSPFLSFALVGLAVFVLASLTPCILWIQEGALCMLSALASTNHASALIRRGAVADPFAAEQEGERLATFAGRTSQLLQMLGGFLIPPIAVGAALNSGGAAAGALGDMAPGLLVLLWFALPLFVLLALVTLAQRVQCAREQHAEDLMRESQQRQLNEQWGLEHEALALAFGAHTGAGTGEYSSNLPPPSAAQLGAAASNDAAGSRRFSDALPSAGAGDVPSWSRRGSVVSYEADALDGSVLSSTAVPGGAVSAVGLISPLSGPRSPNAFDQFASSHPASQAAMHRALAGVHGAGSHYFEDAQVEGGAMLPRMFRSGSIEDASRPASRMGGEGSFEIEDTGDEDADFTLYGRNQ